MCVLNEIKLLLYSIIFIFTYYGISLFILFGVKKYLVEQIYFNTYESQKIMKKYLNTIYVMV